MFEAKKTIDSLREGDIKAFDNIYYQYSDAVYKNIFKIVRHKETAEEILQDVFAGLWENRVRIDSENSLGGWLMVVSHNKAISSLRKKVKDKVFVDVPLPSEIAEHNENQDDLEGKLELLYAAIEQLPPKRKSVFTLCRLEGKSYQEASEILGISQYTVKEHLMAASKTIKAFVLTHTAKNAGWLLTFLIEFLQ
jgi:RNA polymerase sigma factor (sigma-70 family)